MLDSQIMIFAIAALAALSVGGLLYGFFYDAMTEEERRTKRLQKFVDQSDLAGSQQSALRDVATRRKNVRDKLKQTELDNLKKEKAEEKGKVSVPLTLRLTRAGLKIGPREFYIISVIVGVICMVLMVFVGAPFFLIPIAGFVGAFGLPRWWLSKKIAKRQAMFVRVFPDSIDTIVRGIKSGLPLGDCLRIIAKEAQEPVRSEFMHIIERQQLGVPLGEAVESLYNNIPIPEASFFCITIAIQQKAGGNLAETLSNLSTVLRDRKKMKAKIVALSSEAKAGAMIIGSLPFLIILALFVMSPEYIGLLFERAIGQVMLGITALWMTFGILTMRKMINFDF